MELSGVVPGLGKRCLGTDYPHRPPYSGYLSREVEEMGTSAFLPRRGAPSGWGPER